MTIGMPIHPPSVLVKERRDIIEELIASHFEEKLGSTCSQLVESCLKARNLTVPCLPDFCRLPEKSKKYHH